MSDRHSTGDRCRSAPSRATSGRWRAAILALSSTVVLVACPGRDVKRDLDDASPPTLALKLTASANAPGGLETVDLGNDVNLTGSGGSAWVEAKDDDGVGWVELWMTTSRDCGGVLHNPGLAGQPEKRVEGIVTDTDAPSSLSAGIDINQMTLASGCVYTFDVWGRAANAATVAIETQSSHSKLTLRT
jgi:hypothetical protein